MPADELFLFIAIKRNMDFQCKCTGIFRNYQSYARNSTVVIFYLMFRKVIFEPPSGPVLVFIEPV